MRLFIAVPLPEPARRAAAAYIEALMPIHRGVKWTAPEKLHLTLSFQPGRTPAQAQTLERLMRETAARTAAFELTLGGLGHFGGRVIWLGLSRGEPELAAAAGRLAVALEREGLLPDQEKGRPYKAHLTLGRTSGFSPVPAPAPPSVSFLADRLALYESKAGAYAVLKEALLVR